MLLHFVQVKFGAVAPHVLKFYVFMMRVSASQICKFKHKKLRRSIFSLDEAEMSRARAHTYSM
ncbi:hypothetical protein CAMRE0001_1354 [Campylobacter rectus RM3267]|uniref:Uncharacterized protein n=1 Tax=Campylobacter rectus RM3267 TaxID=553218 RepID=B9D040_CAMRE|nr:hypothetical protein CAMRE0001_1354 [Campylobacter rectus RM3267]